MVNYFTPLPRVAPGQSRLINDRFGQLDSTLHALRTGARAVVQERLAASTTKTISGGIISVDQTFHLVDTEGAAATDDLDTINGGVEGDVLLLQNANASRSVVLKHNTGNIWLNSLADLTLSGSNRVLRLFRTGAYWTNTRFTNNYINTIVPWTVLAASAEINLSFPAIFKHLRFVACLRYESIAAAAGVRMQINGDATAGNYIGIVYDSRQGVNITWQVLVSDAFTSAQIASDVVGEGQSSPAGYRGVHIVDIFNAQNGEGSNRSWSVRSYVPETDGSSGLHVNLGGGLWRNSTDVISSLRFFCNSGNNWTAGSAYMLIGWT